jgi:hypothetical protein
VQEKIGIEIPPVSNDSWNSSRNHVLAQSAMNSTAKAATMAVTPGPTVVRDSPGGEHAGTPAQQLLQAQDFDQLALPTAAHDPAVQFALLAASGMIGNQRLEHSGEPRRKSFGSDTLGGNAGALA